MLFARFMSLLRDTVWMTFRCRPLVVGSGPVKGIRVQGGRTSRERHECHGIITKCYRMEITGGENRSGYRFLTQSVRGSGGMGPGRPPNYNETEDPRDRRPGS